MSVPAMAGLADRVAVPHTMEHLVLPLQVLHKAMMVVMESMEEIKVVVVVAVLQQ
jgi:hypothetical protein